MLFLCHLHPNIGMLEAAFRPAIESTWNVGDVSLIPGSGRSPGEGNGNPLQYFCLGNSVGRGAWWATVHGVTKSEWLTHFTLDLQETLFFFFWETPFDSWFSAVYNAESFGIRLPVNLCHPSWLAGELLAPKKFYRP